MPIAGLALAGFVVATYLTLYQLDVVGSVWEPFFGDGSTRVLNSKVSHLLPVPDAALGAAAYLADAVTAVVGGTDRWRRMPWLVILFGLAVGPLGAASVVLVILQPVLFDAFCTLCLVSAVISVAMIGPAMDEVLASLQHMRLRRGEGASVWRVFWHGDRA
ncbi:MAG: vitamin K epoxide reductase family protein [Acidimicrobiia bacterium]